VIKEYFHHINDSSPFNQTLLNEAKEGPSIRNNISEYDISAFGSLQAGRSLAHKVTSSRLLQGLDEQF